MKIMAGSIMKKISILSIALAAIAMVSCKKTELVQENASAQEMTFVASIDATKAYIDGTQVKWSATDQVAVYDGVCANAHVFTVKDGAESTKATLTGTVCEGATSFVAAYPASAAKGFADGKLTLAVPAAQTAGANGVDQSALLMTSVAAGNQFACHNVNGVLKITVDVDGIKQIVIRSNDAKALAGTAVVAPATGVVESVSEAASVVVLNPLGATFTQGDYYIAALPASVAGITLNAFTTDNKVYAKKGTSTLNLQRSHVLPIGGLSGTEAKDLLPASLAEATSSTLAFSVGSTNLTGAHRLALYEDAACIKLVVAHNIPENKIATTNTTHRFVFGGLEQNKTYYYQITNAEGVPSAVVEAKTAAFNVVTVPETASAGDVVLAEDFGELSIFGTYGQFQSAGWAPYNPEGDYQANFRFPVPAGEQTVHYYDYGSEARLFCMLRDAIPHSRLADWAEWNESGTGSVCAKNGMLKIGAGGIVGRIVTPEMKFIPEGKTATLKVTFTAARMDADSPVVQVVTGSKVQAGSGSYLDPFNFVLSEVIDEKVVTVQQNNLASYNVTVSGATAASRIAIGTKRVGANNQRFLISDVKVELVSIDTPADPMAAWTDITATYGSENNVNFGANIKMYKNTSLYGRSGNVGYLFKVPAGQLDMKVAEKWNVLGDNQRKISQTVQALNDYTIFIPVQGPQVWDITGGSTWKYYSPLAYGPNKSGQTVVLRGSDGFDGHTNVAYAPCLGVKNGKAVIKPASNHDGKVYSYTDIKPSGEALWDVEACISGMFQLVKDGKVLMASSDDASLKAYNNAWLKFPNMTQNLSYTWNAQNMVQYEKLRNGRVIVGCTAEGDLLILVVEKFVNTHNQGQNCTGFTPNDNGHNGNNNDNRGLDFYESAKVMKDLGCSDAMTMEDLNWSFVVLQDGSERGKDLFWNNQRWNTNGTMKAAANELENLVTLCIK